MQTVECSIGNSFLINHDAGTARITVIEAVDGEVTLGIQSNISQASTYQRVTVPVESNSDILSLLKARGR